MNFINREWTRIDASQHRHWSAVVSSATGRSTSLSLCASVNSCALNAATQSRSVSDNVPS